MDSIQFNHNEEHMQRYCEVLVENKSKKNGKYFGRTEYMTPVIFSSNYCKPGELVNIKIESFNKHSLFGTHNTNKIKAA